MPRKKNYDVIIIGCGPAGLSASIFCARANLRTLVIGMPEKSQAWFANDIENYLGFPEPIHGSELLKKGMTQAKKFGVSFLEDDVVVASSGSADGKKAFKIGTGTGQKFGCRSVVIATGVPMIFSGIKNEKRLVGKKLHYCVSCDGALYRDKRFAIVGNGNHAAEDAIEALSYTKNITIISNAEKFEFSAAYKEELEKWKIATINAKIVEFRGKQWLEEVVLDKGKSLRFDAVFMACGTVSALEFASEMGLETRNNSLVIDENNMTSEEGVFAAGNCAGRCRQIAKNAGDGCNAAINLIRYLRSRQLYFDYAGGIYKGGKKNAAR